MNATLKGQADTLLDQRRVELVALSRQLCEEHSQLRETSDVLRRDSGELSEDSKLLRTDGYELREVVDKFALAKILKW